MGHAIGLAHFVELIDTNHATVRQHHGAALEEKLALGVLNDRSRETGGRGTLAGGVNAHGATFSTNLRNCDLAVDGVAHQQHVEVAADARVVRKDLAGACEEETGDGLLDVCVREGKHTYPACSRR